MHVKFVITTKNALYKEHANLCIIQICQNKQKIKDEYDNTKIVKR